MGANFKVGDIVTGNQSATERYSVTIRGAILEVIKASADMIEVKVIGCDNRVVCDSIELAHEGRDPSGQIRMIEADARVGYTYTVHSKYFELTHIVSDEDASELNDFLDCM